MPTWIRRAAGAAAILALFAPGASGRSTEGTAVEGEVPADLAGRWLVVEQNRLVGGVVHPFARLCEIRQGAAHLELILRRVRLPQALSTKLVAAGTASRPWMPTEGDIRVLAERWDELPADATDAERSQVEHRLVGPGAGGSSLVIATEERFSGSGPVKTSRSVYTVREVAPARLAGTFVRESTAETPAPVTIAFKGDFQGYRVPVVPPRSRVHGLLDAMLGRDEPF